MRCIPLLLMLVPPAAAAQDRQAISGESTAPIPVWRSDKYVVTPGREHLAAGWLRTDAGESWLAVTLFKRDGKPLARFESPKSAVSETWRYAAVETADPSATAESAVVEFWVSGKASLKRAGILSMSPLIVGNGGFEAPVDDRGRVPMWSEEKDGQVAGGSRAGSFGISPDGAFQGSKGLRVASTGDWFGVTSVPYTVPAWTDRFELAGKARCTGEGEAQLIAVWTGDGGDQVLRKDESRRARGSGWLDVSTGPITPPPSARAVRLDLVVRRPENAGEATSEARFDSIEFITLSPKRKETRVLVNQAGYGARVPKSAVIMTNFFPTTALAGEFTVTSSRDVIVHQGELQCSGRMVGEKFTDWGWYFWRADFSAVQEEGQFKVRARIEGVDGVSFPFAIERDALFRKTAPLMADFFFVQRCGFDVPGWHGPCHLDDARLADGSHRDLAGGWHSAGDYNKITWEYGDGGAVYALAHAAAVCGFDPPLRDRLIAEARWGADYTVKLADFDAGTFLKDIQQGPDRQSWMRWVPPEKQTDNQVGTADDPIVLPGKGNSPLAPGGWALAGSLPRDGTGRKDLVDHAEKFWPAYSRIASQVANPLDLLSALDLCRISDDERYRAFARKTAEGLLAPGSSSGPLGGGYSESGDIPAAALASFILQFPGDALAPRIRERLKLELEALLKGADNPLGIPRHGEGEAAYFFEPTSAYGWNFLYGARAWVGFLLHRVLQDPRALEYGIHQLDFILGKNPYNLCMVESAGTSHPPRYHHRYDSIPGRERGAVPGAIPNGFVRDIGGNDRPGFDISTTGRPHPSYRTSEPWLVHNVFFLLAVTALHEIESGS